MHQTKKKKVIIIKKIHLLKKSTKVHFNSIKSVTKKFKNKRGRNDPSEPERAYWHATHAWGRDSFQETRKKIERKVLKNKIKKNLVKKRNEVNIIRVNLSNPLPRSWVQCNSIGENHDLQFLTNPILEDKIFKKKLTKASPLKKILSNIQEWRPNVEKKIRGEIILIDLRVNLFFKSNIL